MEMDGPEDISTNITSPYLSSDAHCDVEPSTTSFDLKTASFEDEIDNETVVKDPLQNVAQACVPEIDMGSISFDTSHQQSHTSTSFDVNRSFSMEEEGDQSNCIEDFAKELALERKNVEEMNKDVKEETEANFDGGSFGDMMASHTSADEDNDTTDKEPELFVTFAPHPELNTTTSRLESDLNGSISKAAEAIDVKDVLQTKDNFIRNKAGAAMSQKNTRNKPENKRKRGRKPKKTQKPDFSEAQIVKHPLLPPCQCNKRKCHEKFSFDMRSHIHDRFWVMNMYERKEWLSEHLLYLKPKSRTNHPVSTLHESHRKFFLPSQSEKIEVCRKMFFSTLGFKDEAKFLQNPKMLNKKGMLSRERKRKCIMSRKQLTIVQGYCKDMAMQNGNTVNPGTSTDMIIPSGFSLRDMYNDFCIKRTTTKFGYHRFRQIIELLLRGESIENYQYADLREDDDDDDAAVADADEDTIDETKESSAQRKESLAKPKVKVKVKIKQEKVAENEERKGEKEIPDYDVPSTVKKKKHRRKKSTTQQHLPTKNKTILKLPLFGNLKHTISNKRKRNEVSSNSASNKRYNFRESINVLTSYSEDYLMETAMEESEFETFNDFGRREVAKVRKVKVKEKSENKPIEDVKPDIAKITLKKKTEKKAKKYLGVFKKSRKPRKKKSKSALRLAQIAFTESRKKSGANHPVLSPCKCNFRKCAERISDGQRHVIHNEFWTVPTKQEKRQWIEKYIVHCKPRSRSTNIKFPRKHLSKKYYFPNEEGTLVNVCRVFFMRTLGYHSNMTLDSHEMSDLGLDVITIPDDGNDSGEKSILKDKQVSIERALDDLDEDSGSQALEVRTELSSETGNMEERVVCKEEEPSIHVNEGNDDTEALEDKKNVFFTPEMEKEEVEKAADPNTKRRRPLSMRNSKEHHPMGLPCSCIKKCVEKIPEDRRFAIHEHYWSLITYNQRKQWILENITREVPKRRTVLNHPIRKKETRKCFLTNWEEEKVEVCRSFFLSTLGFKWDKMIDTICKTTPRGSKFVRADLRGKRPPIHKIPDDVTNCIREYLEAILKTFPFIPPQAKKSLKAGSKKTKKKKSTTAPAPNGLTIKTLFADYKAKHPHQKVSYATFRKVHIEVREIVRAQEPDHNEAEENEAEPLEIPEANHDADPMSASPGSDNGFSYVPNVTFDSRRPSNSNSIVTNHSTSVPGTIPSLQSCMYNEQPQLLNLSSHHHPHLPTIPSNSKQSHTTSQNQSNRVANSHSAGSTSSSSAGGGSNKFTKSQHHHQQQAQQQPQQQQQQQHLHHPHHHHHQQDFHHLLPFSASAKGAGGMYPIPGHSTSNLMGPYSSSQANPLDPFYMSSSSSQAITNPIAYSNLHFPTDLIGHHPHLPPPHHHHHPAHHHPHLYQSHLQYHNRFPGNVLPQVLKDHDPNNHHNFYNPQMDFNPDHHPESMFPFKDALNYPSFTPDNLSTHSPVQNQIPNQIAFPGNNNSGNVVDQRKSNSSNQALSVGSYAEDTSMSMSSPVAGTATSTSGIKASAKDHLEFVSEGTSQDFTPIDKDLSLEVTPKEKKKRSKSKKKKDDATPKAPRIRKVRPLSNRNSKEHHPMLPACTCGKKCSEKILQEQREVIYEAYWELGNYSNRKQWIADHMKREDPKRRTNLEAPVMRKKETRRFTLPNAKDVQVEVCRLFFLHTLGMKWDKIIGTICKTTGRDEHVTPPDMRGKKTPAHKLGEEVVRSAESYAQALLQASKPEYLANLQQPKKGFSLDTFIPYGLNMKNLHLDYKAKHASHKISYESFRKIFRQVRREVLDPDSVSDDKTEEDQNNAEPSDTMETETVEGTINAETGQLDTLPTSAGSSH